VETNGTITLDRSARSSTRLRDFWDLTKPRMNVVVVVTTLAGYCLTAPEPVKWTLLMVTLVGTALAAAGASVLNQLIERDFDAMMARTADRPLPARRISPSEACLFGLVLAIGGIAMLVIDVNILTASLGVLTLVTYLFVYTPAKRYTTLCTLLGAVPGAIPVMMGCTAATGRITAIALDLSLILFMWQIPHFLAIAILYRDDYAKGGFHILPVADRRLDVTGRQIILYCLALIPLTVFPVVLATAGWAYLSVAMALNAIFTWCGLALARSRSRQYARQLFWVSLGYILCLLPLMVLDHRDTPPQSLRVGIAHADPPS
jgi:protoheme IX farnesyltransferase